MNPTSKNPFLHPTSAPHFHHCILGLGMEITVPFQCPIFNQFFDPLGTSIYSAFFTLPFSILIYSLPCLPSLELILHYPNYALKYIPNSFPFSFSVILVVLDSISTPIKPDSPDTSPLHPSIRKWLEKKMQSCSLLSVKFSHMSLMLHGKPSKFTLFSETTFSHISPLQTLTPLHQSLFLMSLKK